MLEYVKKLEELGMSKKKAILFIHDIGKFWYIQGLYPTKDSTFDTRFSKELGPKK